MDDLVKIIEKARNRTGNADDLFIEYARLEEGLRQKAIAASNKNSIDSHIKLPIDTVMPLRIGQLADEFIVPPF